jgi:hypothetical protein
MKIVVGKQGLGTVWTFEPTSRLGEVRMRVLFRNATWHDHVMYVEHRYEISVGEVLLKNGFALVAGTQAHVPNAEIAVDDGHFVIKEKAA